MLMKDYEEKYAEPDDELVWVPKPIEILMKDTNKGKVSRFVVVSQCIILHNNNYWCPFNRIKGGLFGQME